MNADAPFLRRGVVLVLSSLLPATLATSSALQLNDCTLTAVGDATVNSNCPIKSPAPPITSDWFDAGSARTALGASSPNTGASYYVRMVSGIPFYTSGRIAIRYATAAHGEMGGLIECLTPRFAHYHPPTYGAPEAGNTFYCEVTQHGLISGGQGQIIEELVMVKDMGCSDKDCPTKELWLKIVDVEPSHSVGNSPPRVSLQCESYSDLCFDAVDYSEVVQHHNQIKMADGQVGTAVDTIKLQKGAKVHGHAKQVFEGAIKVESVGTAPLQFATSGAGSVGGSNGRMLGKIVSTGATTSKFEQPLLTIDDFYTANSKILMTVTVSMVDPMNRIAGKWLAHAFADPDSAIEQATGNFHWSAGDFVPVAGTGYTVNTITINPTDYGLKLGMANGRILNFEVNGGKQYAHYSIDVEYVCFDGCSVTFHDGSVLAS